MAGRSTDPTVGYDSPRRGIALAPAGDMNRFAALLCLVAACAPTDDDACSDASAKIAACFPERATIAPVCDPATADEIAASSCEDLAARDTKADSWTCIWMPWLCTSGGGGSTAGKKIEVAVEECGGDFAGTCPYVTSASCGLVTLHDAGGSEVSRGFSSGGGRFTFEGVPAGQYSVKVHERSGNLAKMMVSPLSSQTTSANVKVTVGSGDAPWARFELVSGSADKITQCAELDGGLTVEDSAGGVVDRRAVEWEWLVELEVAGVVVERSRPLFIHHEATASGEDENAIGFRLVRPGMHTVRFVRMDIPDYKRRPNPDYAALRASYSADVEPIEFTINVTNAQRGRVVSISRTIVDPLR